MNIGHEADPYEPMLQDITVNSYQPVGSKDKILAIEREIKHTHRSHYDISFSNRRECEEETMIHRLVMLEVSYIK